MGKHARIHALTRLAEKRRERERKRECTARECTLRVSLEKAAIRWPVWNSHIHYRGSPLYSGRPQVHRIFSALSVCPVRVSAIPLPRVDGAPARSFRDPRETRWRGGEVDARSTSGRVRDPNFLDDGSEIFSLSLFVSRDVLNEEILWYYAISFTK